MRSANNDATELFEKDLTEHLKDLTMTNKLKKLIPLKIGVQNFRFRKPSQEAMMTLLLKLVPLEF